MQPRIMNIRRLAYEPRANLYAAMAFIALTFTTLRGIDFLVLALVLGYVALSMHLPRPTAIRDTASRVL